MYKSLRYSKFKEKKNKTKMSHSVADTNVVTVSSASPEVSIQCLAVLGKGIWLHGEVRKIIPRWTIDSLVIKLTQIQ